jgi:hypothetical protein
MYPSVNSSSILQSDSTSAPASLGLLGAGSRTHAAHLASGVVPLEGLRSSRPRYGESLGLLAATNRAAGRPSMLSKPPGMKRRSPSWATFPKSSETLPLLLQTSYPSYVAYFEAIHSSVLPRNVFRLMPDILGIGNFDFFALKDFPYRDTNLTRQTNTIHGVFNPVANGISNG